MKRAAGLLEATAESLQRGHWRVACRRYLMLEASGSPVPDGIRTQCTALLARCPPDALQRMSLDAQAWALLVARGVVVSVAPPARAQPKRVRRRARRAAVPPHPEGIRTQWQFPHGLS